MAYSSSLTDKEWELLKPLLSEVLPPNKQTRPPAWTKRELLDGVFYGVANSRYENYERTLGNATTKMNLCFVRLMIRRPSAFD